MLCLREVANPVVAPELIRPTPADESLPPNVSLSEFKGYLGVAHGDEDANLTALLLTVINEIKHPTSLGVECTAASWQLRTPLNGRRVVYLPRYSGPTIQTASFDADGGAAMVTDEDGVKSAVTWEEIPAADRVTNLHFIYTEADPLPVNCTFTYSIGLAGTRLPDAIKQLIFIEAAFRREFPMGVGDRGEPLVARPPAADLIRAEWRPIFDLHGFLP